MRWVSVHIAHKLVYAWQRGLFCDGVANHRTDGEYLFFIAFCLHSSPSRKLYFALMCLFKWR